MVTKIRGTGTNEFSDITAQDIAASGDITADDITASGDVTVTGNLSGGKDYYNVYADTSQTNISSETTVLYDTVNKTTSASVFVNSSGEITINKTGTFLITADVSTYVSSSTTLRSDSLAKIYINGSAITGTFMWMYNREGPDSNQGHNTGSASIIIDITSGDVIKVTAVRFSGTDTVGLRGKSSRLTIVEL